MPELFQTLLILLGLLGGRVADPGDGCPSGTCPAVPERPVAALGAPQTLRADEVRLFARGDHRPGQAAGALEVLRPGAARGPEVEGAPTFVIVPPAPERLRPALASRATVEVRLRRAPAQR